ncbi:MAG: chromosomal replication initiator protein DnaA, partial [Pseudolabrys sp.]|nr:chromosomal replication initiator protein DnaA [Pseudolabrys sp.]
MTGDNPEKAKLLEKWARVKERLRAEVGEDIFSSWFARMELDGVEGDTVRLSVPTRFLRSWIMSHYAEKVLACWQAEDPNITKIDITVRSAATRLAVPAPAKQPDPVREIREIRVDGHDLRGSSAPVSAAHEALGGSPLDPRLTFDGFVVGRSNTLAHAAAKQVAIARRGDSVVFNPLYVHAGVGLGKTHLLQSVTWTGNGHSD